MRAQMTRILVALAAALLVIGVPEGRAASQEILLTLVAKFHNEEPPICVGEEREIVATVQRMESGPRVNRLTWVRGPNSTINAGTSLGEISPTRAKIQDWIGYADGVLTQNAAKFVYRATEAGRGRIEFETVVSSEFTGGQDVLIGTTLRFEVEDCRPVVSMFYRMQWVSEGTLDIETRFMDATELTAFTDSTFTGSGDIFGAGITVYAKGFLSEGCTITSSNSSPIQGNIITGRFDGDLFTGSIAIQADPDASTTVSQHTACPPGALTPSGTSTDISPAGVYLASMRPSPDFILPAAGGVVTVVLPTEPPLIGTRSFTYILERKPS